MSIIWSPEKISQLTLEEIKRLAENAKTRSNEEVKDLVKAGMYVGSHGYSQLSYPRQSRGFISVSPSKGQKHEAPEGADSHT